MIELLVRFFAESWNVFFEIAPYMIFGFLVAGCLSTLISPAWIEKHLGGGGVSQVLKATLFGIPLPLCSCGVVPVSASLRQHGAGRPATTAFLLSTPQTGVDSIAITWGLLGPFIAIFRPIVALVTGFLGGMLTAIFDPETQPAKRPPALNVIQQGSLDAVVDAPTRGRWWRTLHYGLYTLPRDIGRHLLIGILLAGLIVTFIPPGLLAGLRGFKGMLLAMLVGIPLYTCATSSTPIALGLMTAGVSPGAALVFLITGPATNTATLATLWKVLGKRTTLIYLATVAIGGLGAGLALDGIISTEMIPPDWLPTVTASGSEVHSHAGHGVLPMAWGMYVDWASAVALVIILTVALWPKTKREKNSDTRAAPASATSVTENAKGEAMQEINLSIKGMRCEGCVTSVSRALSECLGVTDAAVDLAANAATVRGENLDAAQLSAVVTALGFEVQAG